VRRVEGQPGRDASGEIEAPETEGSVAGFGLIVDDAGGIGGQRQAVEDASRPSLPDSPAGSIDPHEL
jgi:hypothetical protein